MKLKSGLRSALIALFSVYDPTTGAAAFKGNTTENVLTRDELIKLGKLIAGEPADKPSVCEATNEIAVKLAVPLLSLLNDMMQTEIGKSYTADSQLFATKYAGKALEEKCSTLDCPVLKYTCFDPIIPAKANQEKVNKINAAHAADKAFSDAFHAILTNAGVTEREEVETAMKYLGFNGVRGKTVANATKAPKWYVNDETISEIKARTNTGTTEEAEETTEETAPPAPPAPAPATKGKATKGKATEATK